MSHYVRLQGVIETEDTQMTYQIINTVSGKTIKNAIDSKPIRFATEEAAQKFAASLTLDAISNAMNKVSAARKFRYTAVAA
jgi:hypothetical protein